MEVACCTYGEEERCNTVLVRKTKGMKIIRKSWHRRDSNIKMDFNTLRTGSFKLFRPVSGVFNNFNPLNAELNPICYLLALLAHQFLHVSRISVKLLTLRLLMSYIYMEHLILMFLDHTQRCSTVGRTRQDE